MAAYLDAAAGAPLHPVAREALLAGLDDGWADPDRLYGAARRARLLLDAAREAVAEVLGVGPATVSFTANGTQALQAALDELPANQREVFIAHELEGRSFKDMAAQSGVAINTLLARKRYAVLHLRAQLQNTYDELDI